MPTAMNKTLDTSEPPLANYMVTAQQIPRSETRRWTDRGLDMCRKLRRAEITNTLEQTDRLLEALVGALYANLGRHIFPAFGQRPGVWIPPARILSVATTNISAPLSTFLTTFENRELADDIPHSQVAHLTAMPSGSSNGSAVSVRRRKPHTQAASQTA
uniref:RNase III domain-containing protein n=1 Tax=Mesocestoides corti TaxID=53468 RepID=A0A5K3FV74_MESCO